MQANPREEILPNELLSREKMWQNPPHILLSNYAMMEYLLLRPDDNVFFDGPLAKEWRFIVLDEAHTYSGAKGIEIAMLLRRLKERVVKSRPRALQCIGTSATLGGEEKDFGRVAQFAEGLFGEPFAYNKAKPSQQDVVTGVRMDLTVVDRSWGKPKADFYLKWQGLVRGDDTNIFALKEACQDANIPSDVIMAAEVGSAGRWEAFIYRILAGDERVLALQRMLEEKPCYLKDAAAKLFVKDGEGPLVALVFLANRARLGDEEQPLLPARYHLFIRALEGGFCALLPRKQFFLERREQVEVEGQKYVVFETGVCQRCNSLYLVGERDDENVLRQPGNRFYENPNNLDFFLVLENGGLLLWPYPFR